MVRNRLPPAHRQPLDALILGAAGIRCHGPQSEEVDAHVTQRRENAVQLSLVREGSDEARRSVLPVDEAEPAQPL